MRSHILLPAASKNLEFFLQNTCFSFLPALPAKVLKPENTLLLAYVLPETSLYWGCSSSHELQLPSLQSHQAFVLTPCKHDASIFASPIPPLGAEPPEPKPFMPVFVKAERTDTFNCTGHLEREEVDCL
eukprot:1160137-Pelagomonas_calceolata.AAC.3